MKKGLNYTEIFEEIHRERFIFVDLKRKPRIVFYLQIESFLLMFYYMMFKTGIEVFSLIVFTVIVFATIVGLGFDVEDEPVYRYIIHSMKRTEKVVVAGKTIFLKKPYQMQLRQKILFDKKK